jgi:hypothetical protein
VSKKPPLPPLIPLVKPYVDASIPNLAEPHTRHVIRTIAGWLTAASYHSRTGPITGVMLRTAARILQKEAGRLIPPEAPNASSE